MSAIVRSLEEGIYQLCDRPPDKQTALEKQRLYSRVGQFLMGSFDGHWWCRYPTLMTFMVRILELHPGPDSVRMFYDKMADQLGRCEKCVDVYHSAMPSVRAELENEFTPSSVKDFFHKIAQLDAERIHNTFAAKTLHLSAGHHHQSATPGVLIALCEILSHRRLWSDFRIIRVVSKWLAGSSEAVKASAVKELLVRSCPGVLQWLVSPDPGIRAWATSVVGKFGSVDVSAETSDGRAFMKVLDEWMYILESGSFNTSLLSLDLPSTEELPVFLDATNCVKTPTNQILWAALDTMMQHMNENSLESLLESFDNFPDIVFNYLNDAEPATTNPQITFVICKCYGSLIKCLGHRYWNHTVHSSKVVLDLIIQQCHLPSWRVFVTKQLIELLPPLVASIRPPSSSSSESNKLKLATYFEARRRVLLLLLHADQRPSHFNDQVLCVATSKAVSTLICDCYEPRLTSASAGTSESTKRDDGALPELSLVDLSVVESSFWWPCGSPFEDIELLWMNHLFLLLVNPENVASLVDHVATTCTTVLLKHLSLAREMVYTCITSSQETTQPGDGSDRSTMQAADLVLPKKPILTRLLERLCGWPSVSTIPIAAHGALFESIGGIAELMNVIAQQPPPPQQQHLVSSPMGHLQEILKKYETLVCGGYLARVSDEVLVKGLMNPLQFPVVAQHITLCLLSPNPQVDQRCKRLLAQVGANKATPDRIPSPLESFIVVVHRNAEAFLRGVLNLLQAWRLHDFVLPLTLPTVKKVIFTWTKVFEMLGNDIRKAIQGAPLPDESLPPNQHANEKAGAANLQKVPVLIGDFIVRLITELYGTTTRSMVVEEPVLIQCLDFCLSFWRFFTKEDKTLASSKRFEGMIAPLVRCMDAPERGQAEKRRAAELLMTLLESFVEGQTRINDSSIATVERIKTTTSTSIESKKSTDFNRMAGKLRQVAKSSRFFSPRPIKTVRRGSGTDRQSGSTTTIRELSPSDRGDDLSKYMMTGDSGAHRPMSAKSAAREQARIAHARSAASTIYEVSAKKSHSFYDQDDLVVPRATSQAQKKSSGSADGAAKSKSFSISQVVKGMQETLPGSRHTRDGGKAIAQDQQAQKLDEEEEEEDEEEEDATNLAALFFKIKHTQKAIPSCSLLPFFRHLLQLAMPALLSKEFQNEKSDKELVVPALTFGKSAEYVNAFLPLLLEECHNEVQEGLRRCYFSNSGKNSGHLMRYESEKPREGMRCLSFSVVESNANAGSSFSKPPPGRSGDRFVRREKLFHNADVVLLRSAGNRGSADFIGVILISESEKGKRRQGGRGGPRGGGPDAAAGAGAAGAAGGRAGAAATNEEELVRILFLNDGELESVTSEIPSFKMEALTAGTIGDTEWRVTTLGNLVTSSREYIALRSVDMLPDHLRTTILTPNMYETTQTELLKITTVIDELRGQKHLEDATRKLLKLLKRLDKMEVTLTDLRSTSIGKAVNKLRKHENGDVKAKANALKDKWTLLMDKKDALDVAPRYIGSDLWQAIKVQYNQSQLQSIHSVLNNYSAGISLLQGPPGTGKTKTIMGLLSGFLALKMPPSLVMVQPLSREKAAASSSAAEAAKSQVSSDVGGFSNFDLVRELAAKQTAGTSTFSLSGTSTASRILRHTDGDAGGYKPTAVQVLKSSGSVRSRLENKMSGGGARPSSADVLRRTLLGPSVLSSRARGATAKTANVLLCAPSNGAVDELVLRVVTDGLMDTGGKVTKVRAPSVHPDAANGEWLSIVRLGNPGEDAPDIVKAVCLPHIIKQELSIHPKTIELHALQDRQRELRTLIRDFHNKKNEEKEAAAEAAANGTGGSNATADDKSAGGRGGGGGGGGNGRRGLAKFHAELTEVSGKVRRLRDEVFALEGKMTAAILSRASIIACTLSKAGGGQFTGLQRGFDALIIDEAAQAVELSTLVPIRERVARVVLVGDPKQLPATVKSVVAANARFDRSLFERIADSGVAPSMLRVQYRMHPFLREFPSKRFYGGMLTDGASVMERVEKVCGDVYKHPYFQPFLLYDLYDSKEGDSNGSKFNKAEASFCVDLCASLFSICPDLRAKKWNVGFVSPYKEQVRVIRQEVNKCSSIPTSVSIEVNTVDGFQGREKDVIIFSCVRASDRGGIGFLKDIRRLNVAITRARFCLFVVGNVRTLRRDGTWNALVESARERKLVVRAKSTGGFAGVQQEMDKDEDERKLHFQQMHEKLASKKTSTVVAAASATKSGDGDGEGTTTTAGGDSGDGKMSVVKEESGKRSASSASHAGMTDGLAPVEKKLKVADDPRPSEKMTSSTVELASGASSSSSTEIKKMERDSRSSRSVPPQRSSHPQPSPRDRSRSRSRDRSRDQDREQDRDGRESSNMKRHLPPNERDLEPNKSFRSGSSSRDHRQRSRSRGRSSSSSSAPRRDDRRPMQDNSSRGIPPRDTPQARPPSDLARISGVGQQQPVEARTEAQKHRERQERLRALRDNAHANAAAMGARRDGQTSRIVQLVRSGSHSDRPSTSSSRLAVPSITSKSVLGSILNSSKQLSQATASLPDKGNARRHP